MTLVFVHAVFLAAGVLLMAGYSFAQSNLNPTLSVIPDFRIHATDEQGSPERGRLNFVLEEVEVALQAPLNPYARADVFLGFTTDPDEPAAIEEAYFTILKGLPMNLNIRGGKFLVDFGKLNVLHSHAFPFVHRPLYQEVFFGDEGLNDTGVEINSLLPTGNIYTKINVTIATGDELDGERKSLFGSSRLGSFFTLSDYSVIETGLGAATGRNAGTSDRFYWYHVDAKYRWTKDQYRSLTLWSEALISRCSGLGTFGCYGAGVYQFNRRFEVGAKFDRTQSMDARDVTKAVSANINFLPVEETLVFRLAFTHTRPEGERSFNSVILQAIFSLGPHKAHAF
jgi:hypothetical protein